MKTLRVVAAVLVCFFAVAAPVLAQDTKKATETTVAVANPNGTYALSGAAVGAGLGAALTIIGAGYGFGRIGAAALESMARQPEVAARVQTAMLIIAALLEGATFFSLIICIIVSGKSVGGL